VSEWCSPYALSAARRARRAAGRSGRCAAIAAHLPLLPAWLAAIAHRIIRDALAGARRIIREAGAELARINRAGLSAEALTGTPRRARVRMVTAALARRHDGHNRCC